jgi:hypothetical protein
MTNSNTPKLQNEECRKFLEAYRESPVVGGTPTVTVLLSTLLTSTAIARTFGTEARMGLDVGGAPDVRWAAHNGKGEKASEVSANSGVSTRVPNTEETRLSDIEHRFVCGACGWRGAEVRPGFPPARMGSG